MSTKNNGNLGKRILLLILTAGISVWLLLQTDRTPRHSFLLQIKPEQSSTQFLVNTKGCRLPALDSFDASIREFIFGEQEIKCDLLNRTALTESNLTSIYIVGSAAKAYNITDPGQLECCYQPFWRIEADPLNYSQEVDTLVKFGPSCIPFVESFHTRDEFIKVKCELRDITIYEDFHAFTPEKEEVEKRCAQMRHDSAISVLIIGVDAVSRLNLHRQMPRTVRFLKNQLGAIEMYGFNKVGDNTFPNMVPVLAGLTDTELKHTCWSSFQSVFDKCPFVWKNFTSYGYRTAFGEDASWMGIFNYVKYGFRKQPTDYYLRVFNKISEERIGHEKRLNAKLCTGTRLSLQVLLNYAYKFSVSMMGKLSFGLFWGASLSHDFLNLPKFGDEHHVQFLDKLLNHGVLEQSVLIFMSDHGIRWGPIRETYQGHLEERLPFLFVSFPNWFKGKFRSATSNMINNARQLTTPFDIHETLLDLAETGQLSESNIAQRTMQLQLLEHMPRGISLFLPVPKERNCGDAGISNHWCTCHKSYSLLSNDTAVLKCSKSLVQHINSLIQDFPQCAKLNINRILSARFENPISNMKSARSNRQRIHYILTIETTPGYGHFEATIQHDSLSHLFDVIGTVSRTNTYGNQSICMPRYYLRLYCFCSTNR